jgi:hypothetical protein
MAHSFIDSTGFGDLCANVGAEFTVPNDYKIVNSFGLANASIDYYHAFIESHGAVLQFCKGSRSGNENRLIRVDAEKTVIPGFTSKAKELGLASVTTTLHDNYLMFLKCNYEMQGNILDRDDISLAEMELRERMFKSAELLKESVPGFENAFIARTSPQLTVRRGRTISCDYDITHEDVIEGHHFEDDTFVYGFHDLAPKLQIKDGGTYGIPYRALLVKGVENLFASGMMITSDYRAHMSTRNTVCCMGQGQAAGTAAALCSKFDINSRDLSYNLLRETLQQNGVYFE